MDLVKRCLSGDQESFAILFRDNKDFVYRIAYVLLGSSAAAEDALQEVFIKVYRSLKSFDPEKGSFTTWLRRITVNHCLNKRRRRWWSFLPFSDAIEIDSPTIDALGPPLPEQWAIDRERAGAVWEAVQKLSPPLKAVVVLRYYEELSYQEIADVLDLPLGTVKWRLHESIKVLRKAMRERASIRLTLGKKEQPERSSFHEVQEY